MAATKSTAKLKLPFSKVAANLLINACRHFIRHTPTYHRCSRSEKHPSPSLNALTAAALALPGIIAFPVCAAEDNEAGFAYSHYQEGERDIGVKSGFKPIEVESVLGGTKIKLSDRIKFAFNYTQDTWGGATPIATAPKSFEGNRLPDGVINAGATPYLLNQPFNGMYFDQDLNPLVKNDKGNVQRPFVKDSLVHTLSQASPETRKQGDFNLGYEWDEMALDVGGGISSERDYESRFGNVQGRWDFNQKLTSLNVGLSYTNSDTSAILDHDARSYINVQTYKDQIETSYAGEEFVSFRTDTLHGNRQDWATHLGLTQVINKNALIEAGVSYTRSTGYMANPYKAVMFAFIPEQTTKVLTGEMRGYLEKRPDERDQWTTNLRYVQHVDFFDAALHLDYRFFSDDWGIDAHTFAGDWVQPLTDGWSITPRFRYYSQDAASFYQPYFVVRQQTPSSNAKAIESPYNNYSSDHRLSGYGAVSGGVTLSKVFAKGINIEAGFEYYDHAGALKLGGGGEDNYADFNYWMVNAGLNVNLSALSLAGSRHSGHGDHSTHGNAAPAGVMFAHRMPTAGDMMVGYRYMYGNQSGTMLHGTNAVNDGDIVNKGCDGNPCYIAPKEMAMHMHMFDLMVAPTDWLNLMLMPQFVDMTMSFRSPAGAPLAQSPLSAAVDHAGHEHGTGGIGDTGLYALIKVFDAPKHHLHTTVGLSAPTGDVGIKLRRTHKTDLGFIHYGMQLGSGTWDFKPSLTYTGQLDNWSWGAQLNGTVRMSDGNASGFAFGDIFQATSWGSYGLFDWLSASVRGVYTEQGKIKNSYNGSYHQIGSMDYTDSYGGRYWDMGFGLNAVALKGDLAGNSVGVEWLQPLQDEVNGYQLERAGALSATWNFAF